MNDAFKDVIGVVVEVVVIVVINDASNDAFKDVTVNDAFKDVIVVNNDAFKNVAAEVVVEFDSTHPKRTKYTSERGTIGSCKEHSDNLH
jgi:hypothetical protein